MNAKNILWTNNIFEGDPPEPFHSWAEWLDYCEENRIYSGVSIKKINPIEEEYTCKYIHKNNINDPNYQFYKSLDNAEFKVKSERKKMFEEWFEKIMAAIGVLTCIYWLGRIYGM